MAAYKNLRKVLNLPTLSANPSSGVNGEMYFNTANSALYIYDGAWKKATQSVIPADWTAAAQQAKVVSSDIQAADEFGYSVSVSGETVVVGARSEDTGGSAAGAIYVFTRSGTTWSQQAKLQASDKAASDYFGESVYIDGDTIVTGGGGNDDSFADAGAVYVFTRSGTSWSQQAKLVASNPAAYRYLGQRVAISGDTLVATTFNGPLYVFTRSGTTWSQQANIQSSDIQTGDNFGSSVDISGETVVVGALGEDTGADMAGAGYVFTRSGTSWSQQAKIQASDAAAYDQYGSALRISNDTIVSGVKGRDDAGGSSGAAYIYTRSGTTWSQQAKVQSSDIQAGDGFGISAEIDGDTIILGTVHEDAVGTDVGAIYVFTRSGTTWSQQAKLRASDAAANDQFGWKIAISANIMAVGAPYEGDPSQGAAYIFTG